MNSNSPNILLIQIRKNPAALYPERQGFVQLSGLKASQIHTLDVYREPHFSPTIISQYDALIIGGMSDDPSDKITLSKAEFPFIEALTELIQFAIRVKKPALLSCGGFMIASMELGGKVAIDPEKSELGVYPIHLTEEAQKDPLFQGFPSTFSAVCGHIKSTVALPGYCTLLASSERCPIHAFKVNNAPFYAFQFHSEINCEELEARVKNYKDKYFDNEEEYLAFINLLEDTSIANSIIQRFVEMISSPVRSR